MSFFSMRGSHIVWLTACNWRKKASKVSLTSDFNQESASLCRWYFLIHFKASMCLQSLPSARLPEAKYWSYHPPCGALSSLNYLPHRCSSHHLQFLSQHNHKLLSAALPAVTDSFVSLSPQCVSAYAFHSSGQQPYKFAVADRAERENGVLCSSLDPTNPSCLSPKWFHTVGIDLKPILV